CKHRQTDLLHITGGRFVYALCSNIVVFDTIFINCEVSAWLICQYVCYCYRPGSIRADAFRGHGLSLLAPARGMPTLSAKDGFSRPSLKPVPASSSNASEYASSAQGNKEVYSSSSLSAGSSDTCYSRRSHRPPLIRTGKAINGKILYHFIQLKNCVIGKCYTSSPYTRRLLREERHR